MNQIALIVYHVWMHQAAEGGYWAEVIELPGCLGRGDTEEECQQSIRAALRGLLSGETQTGYGG